MTLFVLVRRDEGGTRPLCENAATFGMGCRALRDDATVVLFTV